VDAAEPRLEMAPGRAVECLVKAMGLCKKELADTLGATPRTLERWRSGETYPQRDTRRRLAALVEFDRHLGETFEDREAVRVGRVERVEAALEALDSGVFV
jgi:transcriptional regulator with XRE-family HTH domain